MDEVLGVVTINAVAVVAILTLAVTGEGPVIAAVGGITMVAAVGSTALGLLATPLRTARHSANTTTPIVAQPMQHEPVEQQYRTYSQLELNQLDAFNQHDRLNCRISDRRYGSSCSRPRLTTGPAMSLPVDHDLRMHLGQATP